MAVLDQPEREPRIDVLRQDEDADCRTMLGADRLGGSEALIGVRRRHADVDDHDVWLQLADGLEERLAVADLRDDLEPGLDEQAGDALP